MLGILEPLQSVQLFNILRQYGFLQLLYLVPLMCLIRRS